jgi:hypothetical protein
MFTGKALNFIKRQESRLKVDKHHSTCDCFCENIYKWSRFVRHIESDNDNGAAASTTSAKGVYQFTDDSVQTAKNRMYNMGFDKEDIRQISKNPHHWIDEEADCMFLANMFAQRGSDKLLKKVGKLDLNAMKEAYYKFHHTDPDEATIKRVDKLMVV